MELHGRGKKESPNEVSLTLTIKRKSGVVFKCTHYFENDEYFEALKMFNFKSYTGPSHFSIMGFYNEEEKEAEDYFDSMEYHNPTIGDEIDMEDH